MNLLELLRNCKSYVSHEYIRNKIAYESTGEDIYRDKMYVDMEIIDELDEYIAMELRKYDNE